jgi:Amidohydrolase
VKLTGASSLNKVGPPTYAVRSELTKAYVKLAHSRERLVWGSDWPHPTSKEDAKPDDAVLFDRLSDWAPDEAVRHRILVENPASSTAIDWRPRVPGHCTASRSAASHARSRLLKVSALILCLCSLS